MGDLAVDLQLLQSTSGQLEVLMEEFDRAGEIAEEYDVGSSTVIGALGDFTGNWKVHREKLINSIKAVDDMLTKSHESFISADDQLVRDLASKASESKIGKG